MLDLISRQATIDAIRNIKAIKGTSDDKILLIDKAEAQTELMMLPSADAIEVVRCKDCKCYEGGWYCSAWNNSPGFPMVTEEGYCHLAERRTDGVDS